MILQFAPLLVTTTGHLSNYYGMGSRIHRGGTEPLRVAGYIHPNPWVNTDFSDDWSWDAAAEGAEDGAYYPVTPSWQRIDQTTGQSIETPVNEYIPSVCDVPTHTVSNILVEEYPRQKARKTALNDAGLSIYVCARRRQAAASSRRVLQEIMGQMEAMVWMLLTYFHLFSGMGFSHRTRPESRLASSSA